MNVNGSHPIVVIPTKARKAGSRAARPRRLP